MTRDAWHCRYYSLADCGLSTYGAVDCAAEQWLSIGEHNEFLGFRSPERRRTWVAGRIAAKRLLCLSRLAEDTSPQDITIQSRNGEGRGSCPRVYIANREQPVSLSISHVERGVLVGLAADEWLRVGVDLVEQEPTGKGFRRLWFSAQEQALMRRSGGHYSPATLWAAKESAFKALGPSGSFSPQHIEIRLLPDGRLAGLSNGSELQSACSISHWCVEGMVACLAIRRLGATR